MSEATARGPHRAGVAALLALSAAFVWSTYYFFVLYLKDRGVGDLPITAYPFLAGGLAYLSLALVSGQGPSLRAVMRQPSGYGRIGLLLVMQLTVLASTYGLGAVDTSLLTLVGDVVLTPVLVIVLFREGRDRLRSGIFLAGVGLSIFGATLAIIAGGATQSVAGYEWGVALALPIAVAAYFVWTARAGRSRPTPVLVAHATLGAAVVTLAASLFVPGGTATLLRPGAGAIVLLLVNGVLSFFVGPWLYFRAIELVGLLLPSVLMATIPVFTLLLAIGLLGSVPPLLGAIGIPLAAGGAYLALRGETGGALAEAGTAPA